MVSVLQHIINVLFITMSMVMIISLMLRPVRFGVKLGWNLQFGKKRLKFFFTPYRTMYYKFVRPRSISFEDEDKIYFEEPRKILFWQLPVWKKRTLIRMESKTAKVNIKQDATTIKDTISFLNKPVNFYFENHPVPFDPYTNKVDMGVTGKYIKQIIRKAMMATQLEWIEKIKKWIPWAIALGFIIMIPLAIGMFYVLKGLGTGLADPSGTSQLLAG